MKRIVLLSSLVLWLAPMGMLHANTIDLFKKRRVKSAGGSQFTGTTRLSTIYTSWEIGILGGESHYYGDLSNGIFQSKNLHKDYGAFVRYQRGRNWAYKFMINKGFLSGTDALNKPKLVPRNLNFTSDLYEGALTFEYMYPEFTACRQFNWAPYLTAGIAVFHFRPMNKFGDLHSLSTEGQGLAAYPDRRPYFLTQISIPFGVGIKFIPAKRIIIGAEIVMRKTFTDYIDDVSKRYADPRILLEEKGAIAVAASYPGHYRYKNNDPTNKTRGNPKFKDVYMTSVLTISYCLWYDCMSEKHRYNDVGGCKTF